MRNLIATLTMTFLLSACSGILPGLSNPAINSLPRVKLKETVHVEPLVIPITPTFLTLNPLPRYIYRIEPQDVLSIVVWQHSEFNPPVQQLSVAATQSSQAAGQSGYLVGHDGRIYFPLVGYLPVAGKTIDQVHREITHRLREYVRNPQVIVRIADYRSKKVYVFGEVLKPGLLPLNDQPMTIADALTLSGSLDPNSADPQHIYVIRGDFARPRIYWLDAKTPDALLLAEHFELQPNDVMYVSSATVARWNRFLNQVLPTLQTLYFTKTLTR